MPTFLFNSIVFGPIRSRRLGVSLGVNLLPLSHKVCSFNCIYCECGWTSLGSDVSSAMPSRSAVSEALRNKLSELKEQGNPPDVITFAGNGEPTMHPDFPSIIDDSLTLRNEFFPTAKVSVLSNGSTLNQRSIREALKKVDLNILKLDSAVPATVRKLNQPRRTTDLARFEKQVKDFDGRFIIQTLFVRGEHRGEAIDNTTPAELEAWLGAIARIRPQSVMIYAIDRETPVGSNLRKVPAEELRSIAGRVQALGISTSVAG